MSDVLVVGAGIMGSSIAIELQRAGCSVTVVERSVPGAEASSAAGGMLAPQLEMHDPGPLMDLCLRSRAMYREWVQGLEEASGIETGFLPSGSMRVAFSDAEAADLRRTVEWQRALGLKAEFVDGRNARALEPGLTPRAYAATHYPDDCQVDTHKLMRALSMTAARTQAAFQTGSVNELIIENGRAVGANIGGERVLAKTTVLATGAWSSLVAGAKIDPRAVKPMRGQMVELQTRLPVCKHLLVSRKGYLVPRADGRLIAGSTMENAGFDKQVTAEGLQNILSMAMELCPDLAQAPVNSTWAGLRPWSEDGLPLLGQGHVPGLLVATGHFRNGILLAPITARLITQLVLGHPPELNLTPFRPNRFSVS